MLDYANQGVPTKLHQKSRFIGYPGWNHRQGGGFVRRLFFSRNKGPRLFFRKKLWVQMVNFVGFINSGIFTGVWWYIQKLYVKLFLDEIRGSKGPVNIYRVSRPGFGEICQKKSSPPIFFSEKSPCPFFSWKKSSHSLLFFSKIS